MKTLVVVLSLSLTILSFGGAHAATIFFNNNCPDTVWPATLTADGKPQLSTTGFELASKASSQLDTPAPWTGRVWARTGCSNASGKFVCVTADCASGQVSCNGNGGSTPATLAEFTIAPGGGKDYYDVSLVDGFNLRMSVVPQDGTGTCKTSSCPADVNAVCPSELQKQGPDGKVVACFSACAKFDEPQYCCPLPLTKETCPPTKYSKIFHDQCPDAYSYAYDDNNGLFTCSGGPNYVITFCP